MFPCFLNYVRASLFPHVFTRESLKAKPRFVFAMMVVCNDRCTQTELTQEGEKFRETMLARLEATGTLFVGLNDQLCRFPSWYKNVRRGGGKNKATDDQFAYKHCQMQTERPFQAVVAPLASAVPLPRFPYTHVRLVLKTMPLHRRPMPLRIWRLMMSLLEAESSFCNLIIQYFTGVTVFLCVSRAERAPSVASVGCDWLS